METISHYLKKIILILLKTYRYLVSPIMATRCRYYPSCSVYALVAVERFGCFYGMFLAIRRLLRCHPWRTGGYDPVPGENDL